MDFWNAWLAAASETPSGFSLIRSTFQTHRSALERSAVRRGRVAPTPGTGQDSADLAGMGSTLVCALLFPTRFIAANVGDSRLYHFDGEKLEQVTVDHSLVEVLVQSGHITPEEARVHPNRNIITRAMGLSARVEADVFDRAWNPGDILLLCSDGLSGSVPHEEMQSVLVSDAPLQELCDTLVASALEHGATDNITVVLVQNEEGACA